MTHLYTSLLRRSYQLIRKNLPSFYQETCAQMICHHICALDIYHQAKHIALYQAINGEINLNSVWKMAEKQHKICYFPVLNKEKTLSFVPATEKTAFQKNGYGIMEPSTQSSMGHASNDLDLILVPLVAFDKQGTRLGMGGGYYDRTLANSTKPFLLGVAYDFQKHHFIEPQSWDVPLNAIVTQRQIYWRKI